MKRKVQRIAEKLASLYSQWDAVETVLLGEAADIEVYDPYFTIDLDVYLGGALPDVDTRRSLAPDARAFETSPIATADRFLIEELPVSVHFMRTSTVDRILGRIAEKSWVFHEPGTNMFYRIEKGLVLFDREGWIMEACAVLAHIPGEFWWQARLRAFSAAERSLSDLGAAAFRSDDMFFQISCARLLRSVSSFLFAVNRRFEPSDRMLSERVLCLPVLPEGFQGRLESILRPTDGLSNEARREIAELIVRSLMPLALEERV